MILRVTLFWGKENRDLQQGCCSRKFISSPLDLLWKPFSFTVYLLNYLWSYFTLVSDGITQVHLRWLPRSDGQPRRSQDNELAVNELPFPHHAYQPMLRVLCQGVYTLNKSIAYLLLKQKFNVYARKCQCKLGNEAFNHWNIIYLLGFQGTLFIVYT